MGLLSASVAQETAISLTDHLYDPENAQDINELCAGCHGEFGEGGGDGEYPRLAGLPAKYLAKQLWAFKTRERPSVAMSIYATDRELPEADLLDVSIYLSEVKLLTRMPDVDPDMDALEKLRIAQRVCNIPRLEGDTNAGREIYDRQCKKCHGAGAVGRGSTPMLAGQYTDYLRLQIEKFRSTEREHKRMAKSVLGLTRDDIEDLLAYLSVADD